MKALVNGLMRNSHEVNKITIPLEGEMEAQKGQATLPGHTRNK